MSSLSCLCSWSFLERMDSARSFRSPCFTLYTRLCFPYEALGSRKRFRRVCFPGDSALSSTNACRVSFPLPFHEPCRLPADGRSSRLPLCMPRWIDDRDEAQAAWGRCHGLCMQVWRQKAASGASRETRCIVWRMVEVCKGESCGERSSYFIDARPPMS
jgi:hypothetical protein